MHPEGAKIFTSTRIIYLSPLLQNITETIMFLSFLTLRYPLSTKVLLCAVHNGFAVKYIQIRDGPRFFDQVGHQTGNASIEKKTFFH